MEESFSLGRLDIGVRQIHVECNWHLLESFRLCLLMMMMQK